MGLHEGCWSGATAATSRACLTALLLTVVPNPGAAQDWATPEFCDIGVQQLEDAQERLLSEDTGSDVENGVGRLWEITAPNGAVSHLWGTMHTTDPAVLEIPKTAISLFEEAKTFGMEVDYGFPDRAAILKSYEWEHWWHDTILHPEQFALVPGSDPRIEEWILDRFENLGFARDNIPYLTSGGVFMSLLGNPCDDFQAGIIPYQDNFLKSLAHMQRKSIVGLEPSEATISMLNLPGNKRTARALITMYGAYLQPPSDNTYIADWLAVYRSGLIGHMMDQDTAYLSTLLGPDAAKAIELGNQFLIDDRNHVFLENMRPHLQQGRAFFAVGAFHLPGEQGLVSLLRGQGFEVRRIRTEGEHE